MSQNTTLTPHGILMRVAGAVLLVVMAGVLGAVFGRLTAPNILPQPVAVVDDEGEADDGLEPAIVVPTQPPPIYLQVGIGPDSVWSAIEAEIQYAIAADLHRYMVPVPLPWKRGEEALSLESLERIVRLDPDAEFVLQLDFNPPSAWFDENPDARMGGLEGDELLPAPTSPRWLEASREAFDHLHERLSQAGYLANVSGYTLYGLRQGRWQYGLKIDSGPAAVAGFREWLRRHYQDDDALRDAWATEGLSLDGVMPPEDVVPAEAPEAFLRLKEDAARADYARFRAASVADAIGALASHMRTVVGPEARLRAAYGYTLEMGETANGHLALGALLDSDLDGFVAPISLANRGIGGTGGYMGPIQSADAHGKDWILVDDTRTGVAWNNDTGEIEQLRGLRPEDVYNVQRRNFALAAVNGLGLAWSDPVGLGALSNESQWIELGGMVKAYRDYVDYPGSRREMNRATYPDEAAREFVPTVLAVVDESSQFLTNDAAGLAPLLIHNRDEILRAGVSTAFCLLDDLLDGRAPRATVYLFMNVYNLPTEKRERLHARLAEESATAVWLYAPGYRDVTLMAGNIADTVGMTVKAFSEPAITGSAYTLGGGHWLDEGQSLGTARPIAPLFYVEDEESDVLATFKQSEKPSIAMRTMEAGWTSVYHADPELSAPFLRELLRILEQQVYFRPGKQRFFDVTLVRDGLMGVHAGQVGERIINLGQFHDIRDLFDETIGWPQKESFVLNLEQGETRLFLLSPL